MGRHWVELDPDGFFWTSEPGAHFEWGAVALLDSIRANFKAANPALPNPTDNFYTLPGHPWVSCRPRQTDPQWYKDDRLDNHVLRDGTEWTWADGVTVREWEPTKKPDGTSYPKNLWQTLHIPEGTTGIIEPNWTAIETALGFALPSGLVAVGLASAPPAGGDFLHRTPYIQLLSAPGPDDVVVFGFAQYALVFAAGGVTLLKTDYVSPDDVKKLGSWSYAAPTHQTSFLAAHVFEQFVRSVMVLETPPAHLGLVFGGGGEAQVVEVYKVDPSDIAPVIVNDRQWWVAGVEKTKLTFQVQVVGYEDATTEGYEAGAFSGDFDLGFSYKPLIEPSLDVKSALHFIDSGDLSVSKTTNSYEAGSLYSLEEVKVYLRDESGLLWSSDGTHYTGRWRVELYASGASYLTPYIRDLQLKFPINLTPRENSPLMLDDTQFSGWDAETDYFDPDHKRISIDLWDKGLAVIQDAGFDTRERYPVICWEDTDDDDIPDTVRVAGWIHNPQIEELVTETASRDQVRLYRLNGKAITAGRDSEWYLLPQMVDPAGGGYVEHTYAVQEALYGMGLDLTDTAQYFEAVDTMAGTARSRLPGTIANRPYTLQLNKDNVYAPKFDETKLQYAQRIATEWAGWLVYERLNGLICYHPNLPFELALGVNYYVSATIYRSRAEAAGAGVPQQYYLSGPTLDIEPVEANSIRLIGKEGVDVAPVVVNDSLGWQSELYENFVGEPIPKTIPLDWVDGQQSAEIMGTVALLTLGQRKVNWSIQIPLPSWEITGASVVGVGYVVTVQGKGDRLITHEQVTLLRSRSDADGGSILRTRLTTTRLPSASSALTVGTVPYPGRINPV